MTEQLTCPRCGYRLAQANGAAAVVDVAQLDQWCREHHLVVTVDGRVDERAAAVLMSRSPKTLANWRSAGAGIVDD
jgi:hypothetical protein